MDFHQESASSIQYYINYQNKTILLGEKILV